MDSLTKMLTIQKKFGWKLGSVVKVPNSGGDEVYQNIDKDRRYLVLTESECMDKAKEILPSKLWKCSTAQIQRWGQIVKTTDEMTALHLVHELGAKASTFLMQAVKNPEHFVNELVYLNDDGWGFFFDYANAESIDVMYGYLWVFELPGRYPIDESVAA